MRNLKLKRSPFQRIGDTYGNFFDPDHFLGRSAFEDNWMTSPKANVSENEDSYDLELAMPGVSKDEVEVAIEDNALIVTVNRELPEKEYIHQEILLDFKRRVFSLANNVDKDNIAAKLENGILKIKLPRNGKITTPSHSVAVS